MANIIVSSMLDLDDPEVMAMILSRCCPLWYRRHKSSDNMKEGSLNEVPLAQQLESLVLEYMASSN